MGFLANGIRKLADIDKGSPKVKSAWEPETEEEDNYMAIMLIAAAIAAGVVEVVEDGVSELFGKPKMK